MSTFEAGVTLHLVDKVSSALATMARGFTRSQTAADALQSKLDKIHGTWQNAQVLASAGAALAAPLVKAAHHGEEYLHVVSQMNSAGLTQVDIARSIAAAWETSGSIITSTSTENLKIITDLHSVFGDLNEAIEYMPTFSKMQGAYASILEGKLAGQAEYQSFAMAKALDMIGAVRSKEQFDKEAEMMFRATEASKGRVLPSDFQTTFKFARQAKYGLSEEFKYKKLPELILENKGGSGAAGGVGPSLAALHRLGVEGMINKKALEKMQAIGMASSKAALRTTTRGTTLDGGLLGADILDKDPHLWVRDVLTPKVAKAHNIDMKAPGAADQIVKHTNKLLAGNQLAQSLVAELVKKDFLFSKRGPALYDQTLSMDQAYQQGLKLDPNMNYKAFNAAIKDLGTVIGIEVLPVVIPLVNQFADSIKQLSLYLKANPEITKNATGILAFGSAIMFVGSAALAVKAAFMGLQFLFSPMVAGIRNVISKAGPFITKMGGMSGVLRLVGKWSFIAYIAIEALLFVMRNWNKMLDFVQQNHRFFIHVLAETGRMVDWLSGVMKVLINWVGQVGMAFGQLMSNIGILVSKIPLMGLHGTSLQDMGHGVQEQFNKMLTIDDVTAKRDEKYLREKGFGGAVDFLKGSSKSTTNQTVNINMQQVPGHDHKKCAATATKSLVKNAIHTAKASSGNSVGRSINSEGANRN